MARVEYVQECMAQTGAQLTNLYQCSCAIDRIAQALSYDEFVEAVTYVRYATLPGEGGAIFRDSEPGKALAKRFKRLQSEAYNACGLPKPQE